MVRERPETGKVEAVVVGLSRVDYYRCAAAHKDTPVVNKVLLLSAKYGR